MAKIKKPKTKEEKKEFKSWEEYWTSLTKNTWNLGYRIESSRFMLAPFGETPFNCGACGKGSFVFLQGCIVPQSQYRLWCKACSMSIPISHYHLWPYIEKLYQDSQLPELEKPIDPDTVQDEEDTDEPAD